MKVAFLSFDFGEYCVRLASALAREAEVLLLLPQQEAAPYGPLLAPGVGLFPFHKPRLRQPLRQARTVRAILRRIRAFDPDVIHLQQGHLWFNLALPLLARYPLVLTIHDPRRHLGDRGGLRTPQSALDFGFRRAAQVIVHGEELRRAVVEGLGIPPGAVHDIPHVAIGEVAAGQPAPEEAHTVLFFGRIWEYKGLDYLIRAEPLITRQAPDAKIVIAGRGEAFDRYRRLMVHPDRFVVYNEYISDEMRADLFQRASVVALPYVEATQSGVIPVAYTFAKPVVATTVGGLPSMVEHGRTGYLVPPRDERALADAIVRLLQDPALRRQMGANARRKLDAECGVETVARQTLAVYRRALNRHGTARNVTEGIATESHDMDRHFRAAERLHRYLVARHWRVGALVGPDPGIRFNYRIGRFIKSALPGVRWDDDYYYLQAQGYWALANWWLFARTGEEVYRDIALHCSETVLARQRGDGAWEYPNREWKGRVATAEGTWGCLGLLEGYRRTGDRRFLDGVLRWHDYLVKVIGFQRRGDELAVNYFAHRGQGERVLNNSAFALRFLAELADATGDLGYTWPCAGLITFLRRAQRPTGEFPYTVAGAGGSRGRAHFQCYQYNAFQCLDLIHYCEVAQDPSALSLVEGALRFLGTGLGGDGHAHYECGNPHRAVAYHTAALGAAFARAEALGIRGYGGLAERAYAHLLRLQRPDGGFPYSRRDYRVLSDRRSYPRYLAMILYHLLVRASAEEPHPVEQEAHQSVR